MSTSFKNTKIVATVGPASNTKEKLLELIVAGVDVFRLNFSHGTHEQHQKVINAIRELNRDFNYNVSILQDLQGPKIRIGEVENGGVEIAEGDEMVITTEEVVGTAERVSTTYTSLTRDVKAGDSILLDDGKIELKVFKVDGKEVYTTVVYGGLLKSRKGMNLPDTNISEPSLTKKDLADLHFGLENDVDWVAISFVRSPGDLINLRNIIKDHGRLTKTIAKIERPEALKHIDAIVEAADGLMVARGDLGIEIRMQDVPIAQKMLIAKCNRAAKPVIVATQMMESMIENPRPTRAEANDVANAVFDGADAVMLSAETAAGKYPVQTIQHMTSIIRSVELQKNIYHKYYKNDFNDENFHSNIVVDSACQMADTTHAKAIVGISGSGFTAFRIARHRPEADIFIFTENKKLLKTLNLLWGVRAYYFNRFTSADETFEELEDILVRDGHLRNGDTYIITASLPLNTQKRTNMVKMSIVGSASKDE